MENNMSKYGIHTFLGEMWRNPLKESVLVPIKGRRFVRFSKRG